MDIYDIFVSMSINKRKIVNNPIFPFVFIKKITFGFLFMIVIYVDDLNVIGTQKKNTEGIKLFERRIYVERSLTDKVLSSPKN